MKIVLASSSAPRKMLLSRLFSEFNTQSPDIDETPKPNENAISLVTRLAKEKAKHIGAQHNNALIIGGDQVTYFDQTIFGKPHTFENALKQLTHFSGQCVEFVSGLCVYNTSNQKIDVEHVITTVEFKILNRKTIEHYIQHDQPLNCAGSFKSESLGITLCKRIQSSDPTAIIGLPLIQLGEMIEKMS